MGEDMSVDTTIKAGSIWKHRKGGHYTVLAVARMESDLAPVVVYKSERDFSVWVRPHDEFADGRFVEIQEDDEGAPIE